jgi:aromatic-amino-acid transaminase
MFEYIDGYAGDPILTLNQAFQRDSRAFKVNLGIGVYLDETGRLPVMAAVREAARRQHENLSPSGYLPMEGAPEYRRGVQQLLFGDNHAALAGERVATVQTVGGSGALRLGADFLLACGEMRQIWISDPSWDNHRGIFEGAGFAVHTYPYYHRSERSVDFAGMAAALRQLAPGSIVLLHACGHNPTGVDLGEQQWRALSTLFRECGLLAFFDIAYQGFGSGLAQDAFALRHFAAEGNHFLVASSLSKNFSLYGERCGALSVVCGDPGIAGRVLGQLSAAVRRNYSSPPIHGSKLVSTVLGDTELRTAWEHELGVMRERIAAMRTQLHAALLACGADFDCSYLIAQNGMFSFTGASAAQVAQLRQEFGIYLIGSGRMCLAALTSEAVAPVAKALACVLGEARPT